MLKLYVEIRVQPTGKQLTKICGLVHKLHPHARRALHKMVEFVIISIVESKLNEF